MASKGSIEAAKSRKQHAPTLEKQGSEITSNACDKPRRRTAQPNQRQKMMEKIRDAKIKAEQRLRQTLMGFYSNEADENNHRNIQMDDGNKFERRGASLSKLAANPVYLDLNQEQDDDDE